MAEHNGVLAWLKAIDQRLERIERWIDEHNQIHREHLEKNENRLATLEAQMHTRSAIGSIGLLVSYVAAAVAAVFGRQQ